MSLESIGIISENIEASIKFYKLLGLNFSAISSEHLEATNSSRVRVMLDSAKLIQKINPQWEKNSGSRVVMCFKKDTPEQVNQLYNKIIQAGYKSYKAPWDAFWGQRYCSVLDPDENQIDIFAELDAEQS